MTKPPGSDYRPPVTDGRTRQNRRGLVGYDGVADGPSIGQLQTPPALSSFCHPRLRLNKGHHCRANSTDVTEKAAGSSGTSVR
ncbi:hypothetical protein EYF80_035686 [Liparis tanakae]|uniref:Uncharacterized protein n=1 Tax=Liparis tanakae TaxID=230148 RepID=A0A4Z2GKR6_9TELE|nr:hypothetical protein EYF80_035686 [Liparis tanakae]